MRALISAMAFALMGGCLLIDSLDDVELGNTGGGGGGGATGGGGVTGGSGGGGMGPNCDDPAQNVCNAIAAVPLSEVTVTDMLTLPDDSVVTVGMYTGRVSFGGPQLDAGTDTKGFYVVHNGVGSYLTQLQIEEAHGADAVIKIDYDEANDFVGIAGSFTEDGGACNLGAQGLFFRQLDNMDMDTFAPVCTVTTGTVLLTAAVASQGFTNGVGGVNGSIGGTAMSEAFDGFFMGVDPTGAPGTPNLIGGSGDLIIRDALTNPKDPFQTLFIGDFSGTINFVAGAGGAQKTQNFVAAGTSELLVGTYDNEPDFPDLAVTALGSDNANHRAVALSTFEGSTTAYMAANISGGVSIVGTSPIAPTMDEAALVLEFNIPDDDAEIFQHIDHFVVRATEMEAVDLVMTSDGFRLGGHARGDIAINNPLEIYDTEVTIGCHRDAFLLSIVTANVSSNIHRCGDSTQTLHAVSRTGDRFFAAMSVPANSSIDFDEQGPMMLAEGQTFLLIEPPP